MIIVDGPDNVGKSTFIDKLAAELGYSMRSFGPEIGEWGYDQLRMNVDCELNDNYGTDGEVIYDRYIMSNFVYGKICRKSCITSALGVRKFHYKFKDNVFNILIIPDTIENYAMRLKECSSFQHYDNEMNIEVAKCFMQHRDYFNCNEVIVVDKQGYPYSHHVKAIVQQYRNWQNEIIQKEAKLAEAKQSAPEDITSSPEEGRNVYPRDHQDITHG